MSRVMLLIVVANFRSFFHIPEDIFSVEKIGKLLFDCLTKKILSISTDDISKIE